MRMARWRNVNAHISMKEPARAVRPFAARHSIRKKTTCAAFRAAHFSPVPPAMKKTWDDDDPDALLWDSESPQAVWDSAPQPQKRTMKSLQIDDVLGFGELLRAAANEYKTKLVANDYDPTAKIASTDAAGTALGTAKAQTKIARDAAETKTAATDALKSDYYDKLSSWCDAMAGALGKTTPEGKAVLAIRANLKGTGPKPPKPPKP